MYCWWDGLAGVHIFRKIPVGSGDVVSGKGERGELEKDQRLIESGCRRKCVVVGGSNTHVYHLAYC